MLIFFFNQSTVTDFGRSIGKPNALSQSNINLAMISQGASEVSVMFVVKTEQRNKALRALYDAFFRNEA